LFNALAVAVFAPMILARTGNDELIFGGVQSARGSTRWLAGSTSIRRGPATGTSSCVRGPGVT
jgi:hypothetical protein